MRKAPYIMAGIVGGALIGVPAFFPMFHYWKLVYPDCASNQVDGQCGLATFIAFLNAAGGAIVVWGIAAFLLSWYLLRRQAHKATSTVITA
jgi:hypothetical protein